MFGELPIFNTEKTFLSILSRIRHFVLVKLKFIVILNNAFVFSDFEFAETEKLVGESEGWLQKEVSQERCNWRLIDNFECEVDTQFPLLITWFLN